jgi:hypothetical protein
VRSPYGHIDIDRLENDAGILAGELAAPTAWLARNILQAMEWRFLRPITHGLSACPPLAPGMLAFGDAAMQSGASDAVDQAAVLFARREEDSTDGDAWAALGWTYTGE